MDLSLKNKLIEVFQGILPPENALFVAEVLNEIDERQTTKFEASKDLLVTQKEKSEIINKIDNTRTELIEKINDTRTELIEKINDTRIELRAEINNVKVELFEKLNSVTTKLYVTIFAVGIVQLLAIVGAVLAIINAGEK